MASMDFFEAEIERNCIQIATKTATRQGEEEAIIHYSLGFRFWYCVFVNCGHGLYITYLVRILDTPPIYLKLVDPLNLISDLLTLFSFRF